MRNIKTVQIKLKERKKKQTKITEILKNTLLRSRLSSGTRNWCSNSKKGKFSLIKKKNQLTNKKL